MKRYIYSIILVSILGLLSGCNGKQRPLDGNPTETDDTTNTATTESPQNNNVNGGAPTGEPNPPGEPPSPPVLFEDIKPLFETHCVACHVPGAPPSMPAINLLDYAVAKSYADNGKLKERVWDLRDDEVKGMPMANATDMTEEERKQIVQWIEDGGLQ